jgi:hypothetical protein
MLPFWKIALTCASRPTRCSLICCMIAVAENERALQAHSRGLFDKNMASLGATSASPSGITHSAASPLREPVITHAPSQPAPEAAAPLPGGLAATPQTASIATSIPGTAPATPGMAPTSPKTAANTPTGVAISVEAPRTSIGGTLQAPRGASTSVATPGPGSPVVSTKAESVPGAASTPILTSATAGPSVIPSARTAHPAAAGAAIGNPFIVIVRFHCGSASCWFSHHVCVSVSMSQHDVMSCILCTVWCS